MQPTLKGRCNCGVVRFEVTEPLAGAFDDDSGVRPGHHQFVAYAAPWGPIPDDGLSRYPERAPG